RIVREAVGEGVGIAVVGAAGIAGLGDRKALIIRRATGCELRADPSIRDGVVLDDRVAAVLRFARAAESLPERIPRLGVSRLDVARFVVDRESGVDPLD